MRQQQNDNNIRNNNRTRTGTDTELVFNVNPAKPMFVLQCMRMCIDNLRSLLSIIVSSRSSSSSSSSSSSILSISLIVFEGIQRVV